ncbi:MAG: 30S ribosomal protein S3ae [Candidatus Bathyarchaeota archaeon]
MLSSRKTVKIKDKWRLKTWFSVYSPKYLGDLEIASIPASDKSKLLGRIIETTLYDIVKQDISQMNLKTHFQVIQIQETRADTIFKGHEYSREYLRSLVRRGSSRIDSIYDVQTKDDYKIRVHASAFSRRRLAPSQETSIRNLTKQIIFEKAKNLAFDQLVHELILGKVASDIYNIATKIAPLRHVGIRKSRLLASPATPQPN